jgi:hypothetical protein
VAEEPGERLPALEHVVHLAPADFKPESELMRSLCLAVEIAATKVALRRLGAGE